jgi:hypothetical protein
VQYTGCVNGDINTALLPQQVTGESGDAAIVRNIQWDQIQPGAMVL